jgi:hypothetical protein
MKEKGRSISQPPLETRTGPGDRRGTPIEFAKLPKCKKTFRLAPVFLVFQSSS